METWRRLLPVIFICAAIWLSRLGSFSPLVSLSAVNFAERGEHAGVSTEKAQYLDQLPLDQYINEVTKGRLFLVEGSIWQTIFENVLKIEKDEKPGQEWARRMKDEYSLEMYFSPDEPPFKPVTAGLHANYEVRYLALQQANQTQYLRMYYHIYSPREFYADNPPDALFYPLRKFSAWIALIGLAFYVFLPRKKFGEGDIHYVQWRVLLGDFAGTFLTVFFFALPMWIFNISIQQIIYSAFAIVLFGWLMTIFGIWILLDDAWFATYHLSLLPDRLQVFTDKGKSEYLFRDMLFIQPVVFKPPSWFKTITLIMGVLQILSRQRGGVALLLAGMRLGSTGLRIELPGDSSLYIQVTDAWGSNLMPGIEKLPSTLDAAGVNFKDEKQEIITLGNVVGRQGEKMTTGGLNFNLVLWSAAVPLILLMGHWFYLSLPVSGEGITPTSTAISPTVVAGLVNMDAEIQWERNLEKDYGINQPVGQAIVSTQDGGYLIAGRGYFGPNANIFIMKVDPDGNQEWIRTLSEANTMRDEWVAELYSFPDGSYLMAGYDRNYGETVGNIHLLKLEGSNLETAWESKYPLENLSNFIIHPENNGGFTLYMWSGYTVQALQVSSTSSGQGEWSQAVEIKGLKETDTILDLKPIEDGGFILAGLTSDSAGGFKDALTAKAGVDGKIQWRQTYGGDKSEELSKVLLSQAGEYLFIGRATPRTIDDGDLYIIKVDASGKLLWEKTFGGGEVDEGGGDALMTEDDGVVTLGSLSGVIYLAKVDTGGNLIWDKYIRNEAVNYGIWSFCQSADGGYAILSSRAGIIIESVFIKFKKE